MTIWDLPTRLFHWLFAASMVTTYILGEQGQTEWHALLGIFIMGLLLFRLIWGFIGPHPARFGTMLQNLRRLPHYIKSLGQDIKSPAPAPQRDNKSEPRDMSAHLTDGGHNPLGILSVFAILVLAGAMVISGAFNTDDILFEGPLYPLAPNLSPIMGIIHDRSHLLFLVWLGLHIAAILFHQLIAKEPLIQKMTFGGRHDCQKPQALGEQASDPSSDQWAADDPHPAALFHRGMVVLIISQIIAWSLLKLLPLYFL